MRAATEAHLRALYAALIAPIRDRLQAAHLVVVPHDVLHALPFHALFDGARFLIDDFTISYAPSASVYRLCRAKPAASQGGALIMGVPDAKTPFITDEVHAVAGILPESQVFLGADATMRPVAAARRREPVRAHRHARPLSQGQRHVLVDSARRRSVERVRPVSTALSAELVTLSGCGTGLSVTVGGDEQLGLVRGLLYAGARAVLLTLWDAHDRSTADFMQTFYGRVQQGWSKARAAQEGMRVLRDAAPPPVLLGALHPHRKCTRIRGFPLNIGLKFAAPYIFRPARHPLDGKTRQCSLVVARSTVGDSHGQHTYHLGRIGLEYEAL